MFHAKNEKLTLGQATVDYIRFGSGKRTLLILPGLGDGLRTVKGTALPMAAMYHAFAKNYTVYAFSRKEPLPELSSTRDMAADLKAAMDALGIQKADVLGVSMGGMIAQHLAADYPEAVEKLVLVVTAARPNAILTGSIAQWIQQAQQEDHTALMDSNLRMIYSDTYYRQNKWMIPIIGKLTKPKSYDRFLIQAQACLQHDAYDRLPGIVSPTLVIGGEKDIALGCDASREIASQIPNAKLHIYPQWGHGLYEEAKDFQQIVLKFLDKEQL